MTSENQLETNIETQREYLQARNGIVGMEVLDPSEIDRAVRIFHRDGFVVVRDALSIDQLSALRAGTDEAVRDIVALDQDRRGNRGSHRYSFGGSSLTRSMLHRPEWQMLVDLPTVTPIVSAIFQSTDYLLRSCSGDFCLPGATGYQPLHSDMGDYRDRSKTPFSSFHDPRGHLLNARSSVSIRLRQLPDGRLDSAQRTDEADPRVTTLTGSHPYFGGGTRVDAAQHGMSSASRLGSDPRRSVMAWRYTKRVGSGASYSER